MSRKLPVVYPLQKGEDGNLYSCTSCGACCGPPEEQGGWPDLERKDVKRLTEYEFKNHVTTENTGFPAFKVKMTEHGYLVCHFLKGIVGKSAPCGIYERRPAACRNFPPGTEECLSARKQKRVSLLNAHYGVGGAER